MVRLPGLIVVFQLRVKNAKLRKIEEIYTRSPTRYMVMKRQNAQLLRMFAVLAGVLVLGGIDLVTGNEMSFFVFYFIPVAFAAAHIGIVAGLVTALLSAITWSCADICSGHHYSAELYAVWNTTARLLAFLAIGWSVARVQQSLDRERQTSDELRKALSEIRVLETFLPICAECKKIRDVSGEWHQLEVYISEHTNTRFSHGYCPACTQRFLEEADMVDRQAEPESA